jgi:hypothetical protein
VLDGLMNVSPTGVSMMVRLGQYANCARITMGFALTALPPSARRCEWVRSRIVAVHVAFVKSKGLKPGFPLHRLRG